MRLDRDEHRAFLEGALNQVAVPWEHVELAAEVKRAIRDAEAPPSLLPPAGSSHGDAGH